MTLAAIRTLQPGIPDPDRSLGYAVITWCEEWLQIPDGPEAGEPWRFTAEQGRFVLWWYAIDENGSWQHRRGVLRRPKGWGKDPLGAVLALAELMGPCRFDRFEDGRVYGRPESAPWVSIGAVSESQTRTTMSLISPLLRPEARAEYSMEIGEKIIRAQVGGRRGEIRPVTSSFRSAEGARPTFFVMNETQHWLSSNGGHGMSQVVRRNVAKSGRGAARMLAMTNAHDPGEDSIAGQDYAAWLAQQRAEYTGARDILYDSVEPDVGEDFVIADTDQLREAIRAVYGDSYWIDIDRIVAECLDPSYSESEAQRFYLNRIVAGSGSWMDPSVWDAAYEPRGNPPAGTAISLGFDGSAELVTQRCSSPQICRPVTSGLCKPGSAICSWPTGKSTLRKLTPLCTGYLRNIRWRGFTAIPPYWADEIAAWCGKWEDVAAAWYTSGRNELKVARALHCL